MALVQAARFLQFYRRLASLKQAFDADLQDIVLPTMEFFRPDAPDIARPRGEDLFALSANVSGAVGQFATVAFRPSFGSDPAVGRVRQVTVIEALNIITTGASANVTAALFTDATSPVPGAGFAKGTLLDLRGGRPTGVFLANSQSEVGLAVPIALPAGSVIVTWTINPGGSTPNHFVPFKIVLFQPWQLVIFTTVAAQNLQVTAFGYERNLELQEAI